MAGRDSNLTALPGVLGGPGDDDDDDERPIGDPDDGDFDDDDEDDDEEPLWVGSLHGDRLIALQHAGRISAIIKSLRRTLHSI